MGKIEFKLNDSLLRRQQGHAEQAADHEPSLTAPPPGTDAEPPADPAGDVGEPFVAPAHEPGEPLIAEADPEEAQASAPITAGAGAEEGRARRATVQTSLLLPSAVWDRLARLAREAGGLATPSGLLIDILAVGPRSVEEAADELERFLAAPAEQSGVGQPWEEHNIRLPVELRRRLDEHRRILADAGVRQATRAHLVAARVMLGGPSTPDDARALMAERRAEAFREALTARS